MNKIGIIGYGYVGKAMESLFSGKQDLVIYDTKFTHGVNEVKYQESTTSYTNRLNSIEPCNFVFVCVPTPEGKDGQCDVSIVDSVLEELNKINYSGVVVIKSTVRPGFTGEAYIRYNLSLVFSPEFSGENKYHTQHKFLQDVKESPFFIFGGPAHNTSLVVDLFQPICGPEKKYIQCSFGEAELMKYFNNTFFAVKVAFCNEMFNLCKSCGVSYDKVRELWLLDPRNTPDFTSVFKDDRGFGGKCLPKEVAALIHESNYRGVPSLVLEATQRSNKIIRTRI